MKLLSRMKLMSGRFKRNPITKDRPIKAMLKYIFFNILCRLKKEVNHTGIGGLKFKISKGDAGLVGNVYFGVYEINESMFAVHFLRKNDTFLDVGANLGHYSLLASGLSQANSITVEPIPSTFAKLMEQIKINDLSTTITALNIGLSDSVSELYFSNDDSDMNCIVTSEYPNAIIVPVSTIDTICKNETVSLMKIDVEGYEKHVINGARETLSNLSLKALIVELNTSGVKYGITDEEVYNQLLSYGFLPYEYKPLTREILPLESYNKKQFNTIFIRDLEYVTQRIIASKKYSVWGKEI